MNSQQNFAQTGDHFHDRQLPVQEDFYLLDVIGGACTAVLHPTKPIVAYTSGCMVIVHDMISDSKINLCQHQHEVYALAFSPPGAGNSPSGGDYLISIDLNRNDLSDVGSSSSSTMCVWQWSKGTCLQEVAIPKSQNTTFLLQGNAQTTSQQQRQITITFDKIGGMFFVLESSSIEMNSGYRVSMWVLNRNQRVEMISLSDLELQSACIGLSLLPKSQQSKVINHNASQASHQKGDYGETTKTKFLTLEKTCIKIWEANSINADLVKRIHIKQPMKHCIASELTGFLLILGENGKMLILDQEGEFVSTISKDMTAFTTIGVAQDKLLLGTDRGTICVYHMASLQFINEIPYQLGVLNNFNLNSNAQAKNSRQQVSSAKKFNPMLTNKDEELNPSMSVFKIGPPVCSISITSNQRFLMVKYIDSSFVVLDRTVQNPQQAIMGYSYGHFEEITGMQWVNLNSKRKPVDTWKVSNSTNECFVTCSNDMGIFIWKHFGDRWTYSYIDVVKCFDQSFSFQRKQSEKSTQQLRLTSIQVYPRSSLLVVGDNKGIIRVFTLGDEKSHLVSQYKLNHPGQTDVSHDDGIKQIIITQDEQYAIVAFESGLVCVYDAKNSFTFIGVLEKDAQRFAFQNSLDLKISILESEQKFDGRTTLGTEFNFRAPQNNYMNSSFDSLDQQYAGKPFANSFRLLSTQTPNSIRLQQVEIKGNRLNKTPLVQYVIDEGKIAGFDVHPSKDYILITSTKGRIYVYRIDTGELRGTIKVPQNAKGCLIDPSGLYVLVTVPSFNSKAAQNLFGETDNQEPEFGQLGQNQNDIERTTLLMFEIGTGLAAAEVKSIFEIAQFEFSPDAKYISMGSKSGTVCVWSLGDHLHQNIKQVVDTMQVQPDFWSNYPIFLQDYGTYGMEMTPVKQPLEIQENLYDYEQFLQQQDQPDLYQSPERQTMRSQQPRQQQLSSQRNIPAYTRNVGHQAQPSIGNRDQAQQISNAYRQQQVSLEDQQRMQRAQEQQERFQRKTYVEDQFTQITPHIQPPQAPHHFQSQRSAQMQTHPHHTQSFGQKLSNQKDQSPQMPDIPNYLGSQRSQNTIQPLQTNPSRSSLTSQYQSPNKAELLYQGAYQLDRKPTNYQVQSSQQKLQPFYQRSAEKHQPYVEDPNPAGYQPTIRNPRQDYIDRTQKNPVHHQQPLYSEPDLDYAPYEENNDAAQLYQNPIRQGIIKTATLYNTQQTNMPPISSIAISPKGGLPYHQQNQGRLIGGKSNPDPIDIDDDVSDDDINASEQLKELDGMTKYMQNVRVPTKFLGDDYMDRHGNDADQAYTLHRLREEERILGSDREREGLHFDDHTSTYEVVEEMYDQMNSFETRLKNTQQTHQRPPAYNY